MKRKWTLILLAVCLEPIACQNKSGASFDLSQKTAIAAAESEVKTEASPVPMSLNMQCAIDMCGPAEKFLPTVAGGDFGNLVPVEVARILKEDIDPALNALADDSIQLMKERTSLLEATAQRTDIDNSQFNSAQQGYFTYHYLMQQLGDKFYDSKEGRLLSAEKIQAAMPQWSPDFTRLATDALNALWMRWRKN
jgi:hypothetical protein